MRKLLNNEENSLQNLDLKEDLQIQMSSNDYDELEKRFKEANYSDNTITEICKKNRCEILGIISIKYLLTLMTNPIILLVIICLSLSLSGVFVDTFVKNSGSYLFDPVNILNEIGLISNPISFTLLGTKIMSGLLHRKQVCLGYKEIIYCVVMKQIIIPAIG